MGRQIEIIRRRQADSGREGRTKADRCRQRQSETSIVRQRLVETEAGRGWQTWTDTNRHTHIYRHRRVQTGRQAG